MSIIWKGGPAHRAPYRTTHVRVPVPIKDQVQALVDLYKRDVLHDYPATDNPNYYPRLPKEDALDMPQAIAILTDALSLDGRAGTKIKDKIREALAILEDA